MVPQLLTQNIAPDNYSCCVARRYRTSHRTIRIDSVLWRLDLWLWLFVDPAFSQQRKKHLSVS